MNSKQFERVVVLYFSPTGNAKKVAVEAGTIISRALELPLEQMSFTLPRQREKDFIFWRGRYRHLYYPCLRRSPSQ